MNKFVAGVVIGAAIVGVGAALDHKRLSKSIKEKRAATRHHYEGILKMNSLGHPIDQLDQ